MKWSEKTRDEILGMLIWASTEAYHHERRHNHTDEHEFNPIGEAVSGFSLNLVHKAKRDKNQMGASISTILFDAIQVIAKRNGDCK